MYLIDRFGVKAVTGQEILSIGEMRTMLTAEAVVKAYQSRAQSPDWAEWAARHPELNRLLIEAMNEPD